MKSAYIVLLYTLTFIILILFLQTMDARKSSKRTIANLLATVIMLSCTNSLLVITSSIKVAYISLSLFYWIINLVYISFVELIAGYTEKGDIPHKVKIVIRCVLLFDFLLLAGGITVGFVTKGESTLFKMQEVFFFDEPYYIHASSSGLYYVHFLFYTSLFLYIVYTLIYSVFRVKGIYKKAVYLMLGCFGVVLFVGSLPAFISIGVSLVTIVLCISAIIVYYVTFRTVPNEIMSRTIRRLVDDSSEGFLCFDMSDNCIYANNLARQLLNIGDDLLSVRNVYEAKMDNIHYLEFGDAYKWNEDLDMNGSIRRFEVVAQPIFDEAFERIGYSISFRDMTEILTEIESDHYRANFDVLTGLFRREYFMNRVQEILKVDGDKQYYTIVSEIKDYELIEDFFGKKKSEEVLCAQAELMKGLSKPGTLYCKLEEDRFAMFILKERCYEKLFVDAMKQLSVTFAEKVYKMHIYIGVYEIPDNKESIDSMMDKAERAIDKIRGDAIKYVAYYNDELAELDYRENQILSCFEASLARGEFALYLQGQVDAEGKLVGAKGNTRWQHPVLGLIHPNEYRKVLEKHGLLYRLDNYIWKQAAGQLKNWKKKGFEDLYISVVAAPNNHYYTDIYKNVVDIIDTYDIKPENLHIEVVENIFLNDAENIIDILNKMRKKGILLQVGDFGKGVSALKTLRDNNCDSVKMGIKYLANGELAERGIEIIKGVIGITKNLGISVTVEGIDTQEQFDLLKEAGCEVFAGDFICEPMTVTRFEHKYKIR